MTRERLYASVKGEGRMKDVKEGGKRETRHETSRNGELSQHRGQHTTDSLRGSLIPQNAVLSITRISQTSQRDGSI